MLITLIVFGVLGLFVLAGFFRVRKSMDKLSVRSEFTENFLRGFDGLIGILRSGGYDDRRVMKLALRSEKLDAELRDKLGLIARSTDSTAPPIPDIKNVFRDIRRMQGMSANVDPLRVVVSSHLDDLNHTIDTEGRKMINPLALFKEGMKMLLASPMHLSSKAGFMDSLDVEKIEKGKTFNIISEISSYTGLASGALSALSQWLDYYGMIADLMNKIY
jgi:hypothetical protein